MAQDLRMVNYFPNIRALSIAFCLEISSRIPMISGSVRNRWIRDCLKISSLSILSRSRRSLIAACMNSVISRYLPLSTRELISSLIEGSTFTPMCTSAILISYTTCNRIKVGLTMLTVRKPYIRARLNIVYPGLTK